MEFADLFTRGRPIIGAVHLLPLPGASRWAGDLDAVCARAVADAVKLSGAGCDALLVVNRHDAPFVQDEVGPETVAAMTRLVAAVGEAVGVPIGVQVLRNDARAAMAVAAVCGAVFVRVRVHVGLQLTEAGLVEGRAAETVRLRSHLRSKAAILADVAPRADADDPAADLAQAAHDAYYRGLAGAVVLTGGGPGRAPSQADLVCVRRALPQTPVLIGAGLTPQTVGPLLSLADGGIVGGWCHADGELTEPVDAERVKLLLAAARRLG